jgi:hypothetical protein
MQKTFPFSFGLMTVTTGRNIGARHVTGHDVTA